VQRIGGRRDEIELFVILPRLIVLGVNRQSADAGDICRLQGAQNGVAEKSAADALPLPIFVNSETSQQHDRNRMLCQTFAKPFRCVGIFQLARCQAVITNHCVVDQADIGLRGTRTLILKGVFDEPAIEVRLAAIECIKNVLTLKLLNAARFTHRSEPEAKNPGSSRRAFSRGNGRVGASSAA
jgi:hypothetical protein